MITVLEKSSEAASIYKVAGHNLGLLIWLDNRCTMVDVHLNHTIQPTSPQGTFIEDLMHFVSNVVITIQIIHFYK